MDSEDKNTLEGIRRAKARFLARPSVELAEQICDTFRESHGSPTLWLDEFADVPDVLRLLVDVLR